MATTTKATQRTTTTAMTTATGGGGYQSDDEYYTHKNKKSLQKQYYSREDFKEIYCINEKAVEGLEKSRSTGFLFLGCLSSYQESPCRRHSNASNYHSNNNNDKNIFTSCISSSSGHHNQQQQQQPQQPPYSQYQYHHQQQQPHYLRYYSTSDEHLPSRYMYYYPPSHPGHDPLFPQFSTGSTTSSIVRPRSVAGVEHHHDHVSRESLYNEARRWVWCEQLDRYIEQPSSTQQPPLLPLGTKKLPSTTTTPTPSQQQLPPREKPPCTRYPSAPVSTQQQIKHVSFYNSPTTNNQQDFFTRSATSTSFDEHKIRRARWEMMNGGISQERLIDGPRAKTPELPQQMKTTAPSSLVGSRTSLSLCVKSQSTQTDNFVVRFAGGGVSEYLSLSPRGAQKSRMISQPTQTINNNNLQQQDYSLTASIPKQPQQQQQQHLLTQASIETQPTEAELLSEIFQQNEENKEYSPTEECFHENMYEKLFTSTTATTTNNTTTTTTNTVISRSPSNKSLGAGSTSSEGSYSLDKYKLSISSQLPIETIEVPLSPKNNGDVTLTSLIIQPPEGFCDNGNGVAMENKFLKNAIKPKKIKKPSQQHRAKSEERYSDYNFFHGDETTKTGGGKTDASTQSSISLHASLHDLTSLMEDEDSGIYMEAYLSGVWVYVGDNEELRTWTKHEPLSRVNSGDSTDGEKEFLKKFVALTHRMVHRKASGECFRRLLLVHGDNSSVTEGYLEINKRTTLSRLPLSQQEYGFRIHGSRPVVVSAVEANSPAEIAGLEVGDVIVSINGIQVLDSSHSDVVKIAGGCDSLELELARTKDVVENVAVEMGSDEVLFQGELEKFNGIDLESGGHTAVEESMEGGGVVGSRRGSGGNRPRGVWVRRHFTLTPTTLSYSKSASTPPLKILSLTKPHPLTLTISVDSEILTISRGPNNPLLLVTSPSMETLLTWKEAVSEAISKSVQEDVFLQTTGRWVAMGIGAISRPDCEGWVWKLGRRVKAWGRRYCVLKDAVLLFFNTQQQQDSVEGGGVSGGGVVTGAGEVAKTALGAAHLHGYRVQTLSILGGKRHAFELIPPVLGLGGGSGERGGMRHYWLAVDGGENERKRWLAALEYSIDRWINLGGSGMNYYGSGSGGTGVNRFC